MLSIIIPWRDRVELAQALPSAIEAARRAGGDVTIVNFGGSKALLDRQTGADRDAVRIVEVAGQRWFNKSAAQNIGASTTGHGVLFFCDCDVVLAADEIAPLADRIRATPGEFATLAGVRESRRNARGGHHVVSFGYELRIRTADGRRLRIVDSEEDVEDGTRQAPGLLLVRRADFLAIQGYNSRLHGWGWEDQDMNARLTLGRGLARVLDGHAIHISHGDDARLAHYPAVSSRWESRDRMFRAALANYDRGDFLGTYREDVAAVSASAA